MRWALQEADGKPAVCPTNYNKVAVFVSSVDKKGYLASPNGSGLFSVFDCAQKQGALHLLASGDEPFVSNEDSTRTTTLLDGTKTELRSPIEKATGLWRVTLYVTEASGEIVKTPTLTQDVDLSKQDASLDFVINPTSGQFLNIWGFRAMSNSDNISCAAAAVDTIRVTHTRTHLPDYSPDPSPKSTVSTYPCGSTLDGEPSCFGCVGAGPTVPLEEGYYMTKMEALTGTTVVGTSDPNDLASENQINENTIVFSNSYGTNLTGAYIGLGAEVTQFLTITTR